VSDEIEPFVVYRVDAAQVECALWRLQQGERALALFLSADSADAYRQAAGLAGWRVLRPSRPALRELLQACADAGVRYAVLDPDLDHAKRIFDIRTILEPGSAGAG
jgi:hypothetical protein